jgi:hypothetical protein
VPRKVGHFAFSNTLYIAPDPNVAPTHASFPWIVFERRQFTWYELHWARVCLLSLLRVLGGGCILTLRLESYTTVLETDGCHVANVLTLPTHGAFLLGTLLLQPREDAVLAAVSRASCKCGWEQTYHMEGMVAFAKYCPVSTCISILPRRTTHAEDIRLQGTCTWSRCYRKDFGRYHKRRRRAYPSARQRLRSILVS